MGSSKLLYSLCGKFDDYRYSLFFGVAQLVEQLTVNQFVAGSNPATGAKLGSVSVTATKHGECQQPL